MSPTALLGPLRPAQLVRALRRSSLLVPLLALLLPNPVLGEPETSSTPEPPIIDAGEITVSSTRTERGALEIPGNVTRIDREAIERSGARTVPDLLRREAGIYVTNTTGTPEGFTVEARGFNNGGGNGCSTLVLVDGRRLNEPETGCPDWSFVFLDEIEHIEIVRGPASAVYGDNAGAGVIQMFTRQPEDGRTRVVTHGSTGSWGSQEGSVLIDGRAKGLWARAFFDHIDTNGYRDQAGFDADSSRLGLGWDLDGHGELRLEGGYDSTDRERPGALTKAEMDDNRRQADPDSLGNSDRARSRFLQTTLEVRPREDVTVRFVPYVRRRTDDGRLSGDDGFGGVFDFLTDTETDQYGFDGQVEAVFEAFGRTHTLVTGGEWRREDSDVDNLFRTAGFESATDVALTRRTGGLFLQQEVSLRDDLTLLLGLRRDWVDYDGDGSQTGSPGVDVDEDHEVWSPNAALTWRATEPVSIYVSYARGFRSANIQETVNLFGVDPLDPQRSKSYEVGAKLRRKNASANVAFYWMTVEDEILFDPTAVNVAPFFPGRNVNLDRVQHRGIEVSGSLRPLEWLELYASYTYDDVSIERGAVAAGGIPLTPEHRGAAGVIAFLPCGFEIGVDGRWVGDRPLVNDLDGSSDDLPSYGVYDGRIAWRGQYGGLSLLLEAVGRNLGDKEYSEFGGEASFGGAPGFFPSPERNYTLGFRLEYAL
jgi:iron complex outermembrane receptor protein